MAHALPPALCHPGASGQLHALLGQYHGGRRKGLEFERSDCEMGTHIFVSDTLYTGGLSVRHEAYEGRKLGPWRFSSQYSASFRNESFGERATRNRTAAQCEERFVEHGGLPLRTVLCMSAYRKLPGLYDLSVLVATLDQSTAGAQGRFDARGVSFDNAMKLARHYLEGFHGKIALLEVIERDGRVRIIHPGGGGGCAWGARATTTRWSTRAAMWRRAPLH